ncbi:unnamed protein product [Fusarium graminearum]|uniref:Uncharacterized protein n=1 Tax=Gibberella zeae TaxID=5518 RepID=A0A4E9EMV5_GIBZA|nr:unnamed protein product [Fusarium graminearum]CAG1984415.1 unnamed protein product [Fusarium graminearum]
MIERKASTLRSDHKNIFQPDPVKDGNAMTHGVGLVVGKGPGLPKVLIFPYSSFHVLQHSRKVRRPVANPDRDVSDG